MNRNSTHEGSGPSSDSGCVVSAAAAGKVVVFNSSASLSRGQMPSPVRLLRHGLRTIISSFFRLLIVGDSCKRAIRGRASSRETEKEPAHDSPEIHPDSEGKGSGPAEFGSD